MSFATASRSVGAPDSLLLAPRKSYDDGMYHPEKYRPPAIEDPPSNPILHTTPGDNAGGATNYVPPAAIAPIVGPSVPIPDHRQGHLDQPLQSNTNTTTTTTSSNPTTTTSSNPTITTSSNPSSTSFLTSSSSSWTTSTIKNTLHTTSRPTATDSGSSATHVSLQTSAVSGSSGRMAPGAQAGIAIGVMSLMLIVIGLIFWRLHRRKRALQMVIRGEKPPSSPEGTSHPEYKLGSSLSTSSNLAFVRVVEEFKAPSRESQSPNSDACDSIYSRNQTTSPEDQLKSDRLLWKDRARHAVNQVYLANSSVAHMFAAKAKSLRKKQRSTANRRSRVSYHETFKTSSEIAWLRDHQEQAPQFQSLCKTHKYPDVVSLVSVSSGTVAISNTADASADGLTGAILGGEEQHQHPQRPSPPPQRPSPPPQRPSPPPQRPSPPPQRPSPPPQDFSTKGSLQQPQLTLAKSVTQRKVSPVELQRVQVYLVEMDFAPRSDGHMEVSEGQVVRLEQSFDDGWVLCTLIQTEIKGLIPRACLSTLPIEGHPQYSRSSSRSTRGTASTPGVSPTGSQFSRFYRQHSRPGTPKTDTECKPPTVQKQSISRAVSTTSGP